MFGDGHEYDWALEGDEEAEYEERLKPEMKYQDVCSVIYPLGLELTLKVFRSLNLQKYVLGCSQKTTI